jgi:hypothetical protein
MGVAEQAMQEALDLCVEIEQWYVTPSWVAQHYGVSVLAVHRAIKRRHLLAARVQGGGYNGWVLDRRMLPRKFPRMRRAR